jgi:hypothetical protein
VMPWLKMRERRQWIARNGGYGWGQRRRCDCDGFVRLEMRENGDNRLDGGSRSRTRKK